MAAVTESTDTTPSCTKHHRCPDTEARVVEAAMAYVKAWDRCSLWSGEVLAAHESILAAVRAMEGTDDDH